MRRNRKRKRTNIIDLNADVLRLIMVFVAKSSDGAGSFARATSVCKGFLEIAEDTEVLKAVVFDKQSVSGFDESFWKINGLLSKCSSARNVGAVNILLTYLKERVEYSWAKERVVEVAVKELFDRVEAVNAVFTRARLRAAVSAGEVSLSLSLSLSLSVCDIWMVKQMLQEIRMDINEIREHLDKFEVAGFFKA
ncbi:hypothetical protein RHSIM_Rhsim08G0071600 [Rhododendron simsii]|uniref:Uncharacterized protein n=1 Tax=Rhododendron simsii TaxID=118357 RepID=A0A834LDH4_RHOSS|nr:hypothetical protein RHSIM_Rhsim08G0071600 [Rhododendron simsii]